ncbi:F-box/kelch-repeat protein At3g23880-like [Tasmannia lanceolata]|uniref:F-box/kelch-repeat protein At3g23880-like n=1 Tax=Tasmannia lanceolata TaxID=3420 RepID=UPI0040633189
MEEKSEGEFLPRGIVDLKILPSSKGEFLPRDIVDLYILPRLPLKSLCRFKSVCPRWKTQISLILPTPPNLVYSNCRNSNLSFLTVKENPICEPHLSPQFLRNKRNQVIASCNGLLVFWDKTSGSFYIYNPVTGEADLIPDCPDITENFYNLQNVMVESVGLAFDPSKPNPCYKLVFPIENYVDEIDAHKMHFMVFSSETNRWEISRANINLPSVSDRFSFGSLSFYIGGHLYWILQSSNDILEFDPDGNHACLIPFGAQVNANYNVTIGEWEGRLTCTTIIRGRDIEVWIMNEQQRFSKMYSIGLETILGERGIDIQFLWPLPCEGGKVVLFRMRLTVFSYDPKKRELQEFQIPNDDVLFLYPYEFIVYKKSLVPIPKMPNEP